jgi:endonuclease III
MRDEHIHEVMQRLTEVKQAWQIPHVTDVANRHHDPFRILISTVLSLRTKDATTAGASERLYLLADNPADMVNLPTEQIEKAIYPVGFYHRKAQDIPRICRILLDQYDGRVPDEIDQLVALPGVGRKTANLVVTLGYGKLGICVDTHVHHITNRWGYVQTRTPEQTEMALRAKLPTMYWIDINDTLVTFGQHLCYPVSPRCSVCPVYRFCDRVGVTHSR